MRKVRLFVLVLLISILMSMFSGCDLKNDTICAYPQGDPNVALEKYNKLLIEWAYDKNYPNDVYADFPEFYGGAYIGGHGNLVILLTQHNSQNEAYIEEIIGLDNVVFDTVKYSYNTLIEKSDAAVAVMDTVNHQYYNAVSSLGMSVEDNAINVYINMDVIENYELDVQEILAALTDYPNVRIIETRGYDEPA